MPPPSSAPHLRRIAGLMAVAIGGCLSPLSAQLVSDSVPIGRTVPVEDEIKFDMERSRLRLGPVRLIPSLFVTNAGYDSNVFATDKNVVSDYTATITGGLRFLIPFGGKMYFRADALPEYTWYDKLTERRFFGGTYTGSVFGFFNRLSFELTGTDEEFYRTFSSEFNTRVVNKSRGGTGRVEVRLAGPFSLFGSGEYATIRFEPQGPIPPDVPDVRRNDRNESVFTGGVRYKTSLPWEVSVEYERVRSDFITTGELRDNQGTSYLLTLDYQKPQFYLNVSGGYRQGRPRNGSLFPEYSTGVGSFFASYFPRYWLEIRGYGRRRAAYSLSVTNPYFFENRIGGGINVEIIGRILVRGFAEAGPNKYPVPELVGDVQFPRRDEIRRYGGGLSVRATRKLVLSASVSRANYQSNVPGLSKRYTRYLADLSFSGEYVR